MWKLTVAALLLSGTWSSAMAETQGMNQAISRNESTNAIFGHATVTKNTSVENMMVTGKGYWSDYFGWYGTQYAQYAVTAGYNGDWWSARYWSDVASSHFNTAIYHYYNSY